MRHLLALVLLMPLAAGCGKKAPPPPPPAGEEPVEPAAGPAPAEPSERDQLLTTLKTKRGDPRRDAADALAALAESDPATVEALVELLRDKTTAGAGKTHPTQITSTREAAATALLRAGPKGEAALTGPGFVALREGLGDKDPAVREHTARTLEVIGPAAKPLSGPLMRLCTDDKPEVRAAAFDALRSVGVADVAALASLLNHKEPDVKRRAAELVSVLPEVPPGATLSLTRALEDEDEVIRVAAAMGLAAAGPKGGSRVAADNLAGAIKKSYPAEFDETTARLDGPELAYWDALAKTGKVAVRPTADLLKHTNWLVRYFAARTLGELGADAKEAAAALDPALNDPIANVSLEVACTLTRLAGKPPERVTDLMSAAFASLDPGVVAAAVEAVVRMGPPGRAFVPTALKQLAAADPRPRYAAVALVGALPPAEAAKQVPALAKLAADPVPEVRRRVGAVLAKLGPAAAPAADALGKVLLKESDDSVRDQFVDTLVAIGPGAKPAVAGLVPLITDATVSVSMRLKVIPAVVAADPGSKDAAAALVKATADRDAVVRSAAAAAIGKLNPLPDDARAALVKMMTADPDARARTAAVRGLAAAGPRAKAAKPDLEGVAAASKLPGLALGAKVALAALEGDVRKAAGAIRAGLTDRNANTRTAAAEALLLVGPEPADVPVLLKLSREPSDAAKVAAAEALGRVGAAAKDAVPRLIELLAERDGAVRVAAAEALGRVGAPAAAPAVPKLRDALRADPSLAPTVRKVLDRLGVEEVGPKG